MSGTDRSPRKRRAHGGLGGSPPQNDWFKAPLAAAAIKDNRALATVYRILTEMRRDYLEGRPAGVLRADAMLAIQLTGIKRTDRAFALLESLPGQVPGLSVSRDDSSWHEFGERPAELLRIEWPKNAELLESGSQRRPSVGAEEKRTEEKRRDFSHFRASKSAPSARGANGHGHSPEESRDLATMIREIDAEGIKLDVGQFLADWPDCHARVGQGKSSMKELIEMARAGKWAPPKTP